MKTNGIYLFDDRLVITFNYKEGCKTISLCNIMSAIDKDVLCSDLSAASAPKQELGVKRQESGTKDEKSLYSPSFCSSQSPKNVSSSMTGTPRNCAFASLLPGSAPQIR